MHINEMYEVQAKQLLHKLCDALGIEQQDRTKSGIEQAITRIKSDAQIEIDQLIDEEEYLSEGS